MADTSPERPDWNAIDPRELLELAQQEPAVSEHASLSGNETENAQWSVERIQASFPDLEVLERIGRGGMGWVYKARQKHLDRFVAIKILPPELSRDQRFADRFSREARSLARLNHPHIVTVHDFGQVDGLHYLIMEYMDGMNLRELMQADRLSIQECLEIIPKLCQALEYAHGEGLVHRDIKPENILFDRRGHVKVADFGLAKLVAGTGRDVTLTGTLQSMGTPYYMAPEQWERPQSIDGRADLYALGVVIYEMLTGQLPLGRFEAPSARSGVNPNIDAVVIRALQQNPDNRFQTAAELQGALERASRLPPIPERIIPPLPPQFEDAGRRVVYATRSVILPGLQHVVKSVRKFIMSLPLPTIGAAILVIVFGMNFWFIGTYRELQTNSRNYWYGSRVLNRVEMQDASGDQYELITVGLDSWNSSILVHGVQLENSWLVYAACAIAGLALLRPFLGIRSDLISILLAAYGLGHIYYLLVFQTMVFEPTPLDEYQLQASPLAVGLIFAFLLIGCFWNLVVRVFRAMDRQDRGVAGFCRSVYRVVLDDTRLF